MFPKLPWANFNAPAPSAEFSADNTNETADYPGDSIEAIAGHRYNVDAVAVGTVIRLRRWASTNEPYSMPQSGPEYDAYADQQFVPTAPAAPTEVVSVQPTDEANLFGDPALAYALADGTPADLDAIHDVQYDNSSRRDQAVRAVDDALSMPVEAPAELTSHEIALASDEVSMAGVEASAPDAYITALTENVYAIHDGRSERAAA